MGKSAQEPHPFCLCRSLLKVYFAGHAHVKLILDKGMWVNELGMWVGHWLRIIHAQRR